MANEEAHVARCGSHTKLMKSVFVMLLSCVDISRGLLCPGANFGMGTRLRMPSSAAAAQNDVPNAKTRSAHRSPTLSRSMFRTKGKAKPANSFYYMRGPLIGGVAHNSPPTPVPAKIIPPASPRRSENHSGKSLMTGM